MDASQIADNTVDNSVLHLTVTAVEKVADDVVTATLGGRGPLPAWSPGAHLGVHLGNDLLRQYSLCGSPSRSDEYRIAVLREPASRGGSRWVHEALSVGDRLTVSHPRNNFELHESDRYLFIAGGIGITPILPMVEKAAAAGADWRLLYGGRSRASMAFLDELEKHGDRVVLHPQDEAGLLPLDEWLSTPRERTLVYTCGPEPLLEAVERAAAGWPSGTVRFERFRPPEEGDMPATSDAFEVELARTGAVVLVPAHKSILEALEMRGMIVLSSCREGTCGTCETKVLSGTPDHRDWVLSDSEKESNETMMVCVSRSCTPRLVLDL